jgi:cell division protein FtsL
MTQYHTVKHIDNSRLVRPMAPARLQEFWRRVAMGGAMAACLLVYAWQHFECIRLRYQVEHLAAMRAQSAQLNQQLHVEVASLKGYERVDRIARNQLGLTISVPGQVTPAEGPTDAVLAQARAVVQPSRP